MAQDQKNKVCLVCGHDHNDFPELNSEQLERAEADHIEFELEKDYDYPGP